MIYCGITVDLTIRGMLISGKTLLIPQKRGTFRSRQARTPADERYPRERARIVCSLHAVFCSPQIPHHPSRNAGHP